MPLCTTSGGIVIPSTASSCTRCSEITPPHLLQPAGPSRAKFLDSKMVTSSLLSIILAIFSAKMLNSVPEGPPPITAIFAPSRSSYSELTDISVLKQLQILNIKSLQFLPDCFLIGRFAVCNKNSVRHVQHFLYFPFKEFRREMSGLHRNIRELIRKGDLNDKGVDLFLPRHFHIFSF